MAKVRGLKWDSGLGFQGLGFWKSEVDGVSGIPKEKVLLQELQGLSRPSQYLKGEGGSESIVITPQAT